MQDGLQLVDDSSLENVIKENKKNILIVGITGFLGRNLAKKLWFNYKSKFNIIGTGLSPNKIALFKNIRRSWKATELNIPTHCIDIVYDSDKLESIFKERKIDYVIHCAALKYIDIATKNPEKAVDININGTINIIKLANKYNVKNLIALSTDKANKPINTYGMTKYLMEEIVKYHKYSIYQGVNFFWSDGSVLDIWTRQVKKGEDMCVTNFNQSRYYSKISDICNDIIENLDNKNAFLIPSKIFSIKLKDLFYSFIEFFDYDEKKCFVMGDRENEKLVEDLLSQVDCKILTKKDEIIEYLKDVYENDDISFL